MSSVMTREFPVPLDLREVGGGAFQLLGPYAFIDSVEGYVRVPKGAVTDFYSVPRALRCLVTGVQSSNGPAVLHDWAYRAQIFGPGKRGRRRADALLDRAMRAHPSPVGWWTRCKIIAGLKAGGWLAYRAAGRRIAELTDRLGRSPTPAEIIDLTRS